MVFIISLLNGRTGDLQCTYEIVLQCHILRHMSHVSFGKKEQSLRIGGKH